MGAPPVSSLYQRIKVTKSSSEPTVVMLHGIDDDPPTTTVCDVVDARPEPVELVESGHLVGIAINVDLCNVCWDLDLDIVLEPF